ncbi:mannose-binding protein A-like [Cloeon dipterum]|uniref:mannose-binding protein A-like n=1 Tax=Cloeon dipterum TaxID=197152 RepID=UPI00322080C1
MFSCKNFKQGFSATLAAAFVAVLLPGLTHVYRADMKNFEDAKASCDQMGARLAVANSETEVKLIGNLAKYSESSFQYAFVGRFFDNTNWVPADPLIYFTGTLLANSGWVGWRAGEPNQASYTMPNCTQGKESCYVTDNSGLHNDISCESQYPYICEFYRKPCVKP